MRIVKALIFLTLAPVLMLLTGGLIESGHYALAQLPPPNPLVAPVAPPAAPAPLAAPVQPQGIPSLAAVPTPQATSSAAVARAFNCSCFGAGIGTRWMGTVAAPGYFAARQAATGACIAYNESKEPAPPLLNTHNGSSFAPAVTLPQGFENPHAGASPGLPGGVEVSTSGQLASCTQCVCD